MRSTFWLIMVILVAPIAFNIWFVCWLGFVTNWMTTSSTSSFPLRIMRLKIFRFLVLVSIILVFFTSISSSISFIWCRRVVFNCSLQCLLIFLFLINFLLMNQQRIMQFINWEFINILIFFYRTNNKIKFWC